jgi:GINS complex subunit 4
MDIDDILASVDQGPSSASHSPFQDVQELTRFWVAERAAPEILPWSTELMDRMMERVKKQVSHNPVS